MSDIYADFEKHYQELMKSIPADVKLDMPTLCFIKSGMFVLYGKGMAYMAEKIV